VIGGLEGFAFRRMRNPLVWLFADGLLQQDPLLNALVRDTIALTMLQAGYKPNVIPGRAEAVLDCRLLPDTDPGRFLAKLAKAIQDPSIRIEILQQPQTTPESPVDHPLFRALESAGARVYPRATVAPFMSPAGTDSRFFRRRGTPAYGILPVLLPRDVADTPHGIDERIPASALGPAVRFVYEALRQL
jgi:acetylornithine deacetylase/succinyl-diaminopimelate desuccinylase-like protein